MYYYKDANGNIQVGSSYPKTSNGTADTISTDGTASTGDSATNISNYIDLTDINIDNTNTATQDDLIKKMMTTTMNGIEGLPYQFMPSVDSRLNNTGKSTKDSMVGRKYAEKIIHE